MTKKPADAPERRIRWELLVPALTALATLAISTSANFLLEQRRFEFQVLRYVLDQKLEPAPRARMLCDLADAGYLKDRDGDYRRTVIDGRRPCAERLPEVFSARQAYKRLERELGLAGASGIHEVSAEAGFVKVNGRPVDYLDSSDALISVGPVVVIRIGLTDPGRRADGVKAFGSLYGTGHLVVTREGRIHQIRNLYDPVAGQGVAVFLTTHGWLDRKPVGRDGRMAFVDRFGRPVAQGDAVAVDGGRFMRRLDPWQIEALEQLIDGLCGTLDGQPLIEIADDARTLLAAQGVLMTPTRCRTAAPAQAVQHDG